MMYADTQYRPATVYTTCGRKEISNVYPGDHVYTWGSSQPMEVIGVEPHEQQRLYRIVYTDGREQVVGEYELIYNGDTMIVADELFRTCHDRSRTKPFQKLRLQPIRFHESADGHTLDPDPMTAGALITYGVYDDPYINLPIGCDRMNQHIAHRYNLDYAAFVATDRRYYHFNDQSDDHMITWREFFQDYKTFITSKNTTDTVIPPEYQYASIKDRWHYIQGAFEIGYDRQTSPDHIRLTHWSYHRLEELKLIMYSLGIGCHISYDPNLTKNGWKWRMDIVGKFEGYPGFFYDENEISRAANNDYRDLHLVRDVPFGIQRIVSCGRGYVSNIRLEQPHVPYYTALFLPKVSV